MCVCARMCMHNMHLQKPIGATLMAFTLRLDRAAIQNGIFGYNGLLVGIALAVTLSMRSYVYFLLTFDVLCLCIF